MTVRAVAVGFCKRWCETAGGRDQQRRAALAPPCPSSSLQVGGRLRPALERSFAPAPRTRALLCACSSDKPPGCAQACGGWGSKARCRGLRGDEAAWCAAAAGSDRLALETLAALRYLPPDRRLLVFSQVWSRRMGRFMGGSCGKIGKLLPPLPSFLVFWARHVGTKPCGARTAAYRCAVPRKAKRKNGDLAKL